MAVGAVARTAVRPVDGELAGWHPVDLAGVVGRETLERAGLDAGQLDEVVVGCADPVGACGADAARAVVVAAGWPSDVGGMVIDRGETSGLAAVQAAVAAIRSGQARTVLVIGLGLCSVVPPGAAALNRTYGAPWGGVAERFADAGGLLPGPRLAERAARAAGIGRDELDAAAEESRRQRASAGPSSRQPEADDAGMGGSRRRRASAGPSKAIVAVAARPGDAAGRGVYRGDPVAADAVRQWGDASGLPPSFDDDGLLTAATFAPPADAVAAVLLHARPAASESGAPLARTEGAQEVDSGTQTGETPPTTTAGQTDRPEAHPAAAVGQTEGPAARLATTAGQTDRPEARPAPAPLWTVAGVGRAAGDPFDPVGDVAVAVGRALAEAGVELDAVGDIAVAEHDAATGLLVAQALGIDAARINRGGGSVATGNAGAAEELRLVTDGLADEARSPGPLLTVSAGPTGSAAVLWRDH